MRIRRYDLTCPNAEILDAVGNAFGAWQVVGSQTYQVRYGYHDYLYHTWYDLW